MAEISFTTLCYIEKENQYLMTSFLVLVRIKTVNKEAHDF